MSSRVSGQKRSPRSSSSSSVLKLAAFRGLKKACPPSLCLAGGTGCKQEKLCRLSTFKQDDDLEVNTFLQDLSFLEGPHCKGPQNARRCFQKTTQQMISMPSELCFLSAKRWKYVAKRGLHRSCRDIAL